MPLTSLLTPAGGVTPAMARPRTAGEIRDAAWDNAMLNLRSDSQHVATNRAMENAFTPLKDQMRKQDPEFSDSLIERKVQEQYVGANRGVGDYGSDTRLRYEVMREFFSERGMAVPDYAEIEAEAANMANMARDEFQKAQTFAYTESPRMAAFAGMAGPLVTDPFSIMSFGLAAPMSTGRVLSTMAVEGGIAAGVEVPIQAIVKNWHDQRGLEYTANEAALNVAISVLGSSGLAGTMAYGLSKLNRAQPGGPSSPTTREAQQDAATQAMDEDAAEAPAPTPEDDGYVTSLTASLSQTPTPNAWLQTDMASALYEVAMDFPPGPLRAEMTAQASDSHLLLTNPAVHRVTRGSELDTITYTLDRPETLRMHQANVANAIESINRGEIPNPPYKQELSLELFSAGTDARHVTWAQQLSARNIPQDLRGAEYNRFLNELVFTEAAPMLQRIRQRAEVPADGKPVPLPEPPNLPSQAVLANRAEQAAKRIDDLQAEVRSLRETRAVEYRKAAEKVVKARQSTAKTPSADKLTEAGEGKWTFTFAREKFRLAESNNGWVLKNRAGEEKTFPTAQAALEGAREHTVAYRKALTAAEAIKSRGVQKVQKSYRTRLRAAVKAQRERSEALAEIAEQMATWRSYQRAKAPIDRQNWALRAEQAIKELGDGKVPKELRGLRQRLHESIKELAADTARVQELANTGVARQALTSATWTGPGYRVDFLDAFPELADRARLQQALSKSETPQAFQAEYAEFTRLPDDFEIRFVDGDETSVVTAAELRARHEEDDIILENLRGCVL